jgi:predicted transcriptional regulator
MKTNRTQKALEILEHNPALSVADVAAMMGISHVGVYRARKLRREAALVQGRCPLCASKRHTDEVEAMIVTRELARHRSSRAAIDAELNRRKTMKPAKPSAIHDAIVKTIDRFTAAKLVPPTSVALADYLHMDRGEIFRALGELHEQGRVRSVSIPTSLRADHVYQILMTTTPEWIAEHGEPSWQDLEPAFLTKPEIE